MRIEWQKVKLLAGANENVLQSFDECGWMVSYSEGEDVLLEGDECEAVYFISSGMIEVFRSTLDGREHTLRVFNKGEVFNLVPALLNGAKNPASARCMVQSDILIINKQDLQEILNKFPKFAVNVLQVMAERLAEMTSMAGAMALHSVRQRTAAFLIKEAAAASQAKIRYWTQNDMARQVGTVRDVLGRILRQFEEKGLIRRKGGNISLINRKELEKIANGVSTT